jgi:hypothetical protein
MPTNRLAALAHYVIWKCDPADLGATKLNKILWFADLEHYRRTGRSITGASAYTKLPHGPVPKGITHALGALEDEHKIAQSGETHYGYPKTMFLALARPDLSPFAADEIAIVDMVAELICHDHTAASISQLSHDALWEETEVGADMAIGAGAVVAGDATADDIAWAQRALAD